MSDSKLHTYEYKLAFVQATRDLPEDVQRIIFEKANEKELVCPDAPRKQILYRGDTSFPTEKFETLVRKWREKWGKIE